MRIICSKYTLFMRTFISGRRRAYFPLPVTRLVKVSAENPACEHKCEAQRKNRNQFFKLGQ